jgi:DNA-directed RNA polymerase specialized sigma24 family protein
MAAGPPERTARGLRPQGPGQPAPLAAAPGRGRGQAPGPAAPEEAVQPDLGTDGLVLWSAVRRLPAKQRAVLVLRYHQDLPEAEVARLLRLPLGTVKSLAHRGLVRLRTELGSPAMEESRRWRT